MIFVAKNFYVEKEQKMNRKRYTYVFWDWNGTIIDDLEINCSVINTLLNDRKKDTVSLSQYRQAFTFPIKEFYRRVGFSVVRDEYQQLVYNYWELYKRKSKDIPLMAGVLDTLSLLKKNQIKQYILSASDKRMVIDQISTYGIQDLFEEVIAPEDGYALGKIDLAKQWMSARNISSPNVILIGDTLHDFETAKAINVDCALVNKGHQDLSALVCGSGIMVFDSICELVDAIFDVE